MDDSFNDKIRKATSEAHSSKQEAFAETLRRQNAEKNALDAIRRVSFLTKNNLVGTVKLFWKRLLDILAGYIILDHHVC